MILTNSKLNFTTLYALSKITAFLAHWCFQRKNKKKFSIYSYIQKEIDPEKEAPLYLREHALTKPESTLPESSSSKETAFHVKKFLWRNRF